MSKYYTTVNLMGGHNRKIDKLNEELRNYEDMLVTSDESKQIEQMNLTELIKRLNEDFPRCHDMTAHTWGTPYGNTEHFQIKGAADQSASVVFHKIAREV